MKKAFIPLGVIAVLLLLLLCRCSDFTISWNTVSYTHHDIKPRLKVYIENSGSMDGYMCDGSELKDAVYSYVSTLRSYADTLELYYINSDTIPYKGNLQHFIRELTPAAFRRVGGNHSNSDIGAMFEMMLSRHDSTTVSIFVSDCILDVPQGTARDYLVNRQIDIRNAFVTALQKDGDLGVEIFRLTSTFTGTYFYDRGGERLTAEIRPYFIWVIGNKHALAYLNKQVPFSEIKHGIKNYCAFVTPERVPFVMTDRFGIIQKKPIIKCKSARDGKYEIRIHANLSPLLQLPDMLGNLSLYTTSNPAIAIESVMPLQQGGGDNTHVISLSISESTKSCADSIVFTLPDRPSWLTAVNDTTGSNVKEHINQTTGIENIVMGVSDAYRQHRKLFAIPFVITNN